MQISEVGVQITAEMGPLNATDIFCSSDPSQMMSKALSAEGNGKSIVVDSWIDLPPLKSLYPSELNLIELIAFMCPERMYLQSNWMVVSIIEWLVHTAHQGQAGRIHLLKTKMEGGLQQTGEYLWAMAQWPWSQTYTPSKRHMPEQVTMDPLTPCQCIFLSYCIQLCLVLFLMNLYK